MEKLLVSILICSKNRFDSLRHLVNQLRIIETEDFKLEIVVVEEIANPDPIKGTVYCHLPVKGLGFGYARQRAVEAAHGSVLVFIDDDCLPLPDWLNNLLVPFNNQDISAVGGGILLQSSGSIGKAVALLGFPAGGIARLLRCGNSPQVSRELSTGNLAIRTEAVEKVGGFSVSHKYGGEDQELVRALPGITLFQPTALVYHKQRDTIKDIWKWFARRGKGEYFINRGLGIGHLHALIYPWRWSWWWRLTFLIAFSVFFGLMPLIILFICYFLFLLFRTFLANRNKSLIPEVETCRKQILKLASLLWAPIVRITMDLGREWGRLGAMLEDIKGNE